MKPQHVIYLTGSAAVHYTWNRTAYVAVAGYDLGEDDLSALVASVAQAPVRPTAIIVDVLEEEHARDTMPQLGRRDQEAMLARRLARQFPRTGYRTAAVQGRLPEDPPTSRVLLSGLSKADALRQLQGLLAAARVPVASVCSPALLSLPLLVKLRPAGAGDAVLIVSRQREGGLRLSFFRRKELVGSRLLRQSVAAPPGDFARLVRQLEESVRYFDPAFVPGAANPVDVLLLCESGLDAAAARAEGSGHDGFRLHVPDADVAGRTLGIRGGLQPGNGDLLFVELLRRQTPAGNFAPAEERRYFQLYQLRVFGKAACLALAATGLTASALEGVGLAQLARETAAVQAAIADVQAQLDASLADEGQGADPLEMQRIGTAWQLLRQHAVEPEEILGLVSAAVQANPQVELDGIEWAVVQPQVAAEGEDPAPPAAEPATEPAADDPSAETDAATGAEPPAPDAAGTRVRLTIRGRVEPFDGNYPVAFLGVRTFMTTLGADPRVVSVRARREPLDISPRSTLSGEMTPNVRAEKASFTLNVLVRVTHGPA